MLLSELSEIVNAILTHEGDGELIPMDDGGNEFIINSLYSMDSGEIFMDMTFNSKVVVEWEDDRDD